MDQHSDRQRGNPQSVYRHDHHHGIVQLLEAKAVTSALTEKGISNYLKLPGNDIIFNTEYFLKHLADLKDVNPAAVLRSGQFEVEFLINSPHSAEVGAKLLDLLGGNLAKYRFEGIQHEIKIIITAVSN